MNIQAGIGHNNPPDPIDTAVAPFAAIIEEAESWLDGERVESEGQMKAVDLLLKGVKEAKKAVDSARDAETAPLHEAWKKEVARWKPTQDDLDRMTKGLAALVNDFKVKLAAEKEAARIAAEKAAWAAAEEARQKAAAADAANIEAQREAAAAMQAAEDAQAAAQAAKKDTVKGLRTYTIREITDGVACARWLWANDREALLEWMADRVKRLPGLPDGVTERTEKRAV